MANKKISEDNEITTPASGDFFPFYRGAENYRIDWDNFGYLQTNLTNLVSTGAFVNAAEYDTINDAVDALPAAGGTVFVPPGDYTIDTAITESRLAIIGCGKDQTTITATETLDHAIKFLDDGGTTYFVLDGFTLDGDDKVTNCVYIEGDYPRLQHLNIKDCSNACVYNKDGWSLYLEDVSTGGTAPYGLYSADAGVNTVIHMHRNHCDNGLYFRKSATAPEGVRITNSLIFATGGSAISVEYANVFIVDNCILDGVTHKGVHFGTDCIRGKVTNCYIDCNGATADGDDCVYIEDNCSDMVIANNSLLSGHYGIKVNASAGDQTSGIKITNNSFSGTISKDIWLDSVLRGRVTGNHCTNVTSTIYEHNTKSNGQNIITGNYLASAPNKSIASIWYNNIGDLAWYSWTPTWTNVTVGNGTVDAKYKRVDNIITCRLSLEWGATTSASGIFQFTLPITAISYPNVANNIDVIGQGGILDTGAGNPHMVAQVKVISTTGAKITYVDVNANGQDATNTAPMTWTTGDKVTVEFTYEAA